MYLEIDNNCLGYTVIAMIYVKESSKELAKAEKKQECDMSSCFGAGNFGFHYWPLSSFLSCQN